MVDMVPTETGEENMTKKRAIQITSGTINQAVADYTGRDVVGVEVVPDPQFPGVFAVQAEIKYEASVEVSQFLIKNVPLQKVTYHDLEEVVFTTWPPSQLT